MQILWTIPKGILCPDVIKMQMGEAGKRAQFVIIASTSRELMWSVKLKRGSRHSHHSSRWKKTLFTSTMWPTKSLAMSLSRDFDAANCNVSESWLTIFSIIHTKDAFLKPRRDDVSLCVQAWCGKGEVKMFFWKTVCECTKREGLATWFRRCVYLSNGVRLLNKDLIYIRWLLWLKVALKSFHVWKS